MSTRFLVTTPPGRGAVATVSIVGPCAGDVVAARFTPADPRWMNELPLRRIVLGRWRSADGLEEELVVCRLSHQRIDVHCHGGPAPVAAIVESLTRLGAMPATAEEWSRIGESALSAIAREARIALAGATTDRTADILLDQFHGAQERAARDVVLVARDRALAIVDRALDSSGVGLHLTTPWKVVIAGRPNVGKSSLVNRLLGYQRAIVFDQPGTTRDVLSATTALEGWPIELCDTAGLRSTDEPIEAAGVALAQVHMDQANAVVLVAESPAEWGEDERRLAALVERPVVLYNKTDQGWRADDAKPRGWRVSATTGEGLDAAWKALVERLVPDPPAPGEAVPFTSRQIALWRAIRTALAENDHEALDIAIERLIHDHGETT